jgi:hypothetical protein
MICSSLSETVFSELPDTCMTEIGRYTGDLPMLYQTPIPYENHLYYGYGDYENGTNDPSTSMIMVLEEDPSSVFIKGKGIMLIHDHILLLSQAADAYATRCNVSIKGRCAWFPVESASIEIVSTSSSEISISITARERENFWRDLLCENIDEPTVMSFEVPIDVWEMFRVFHDSNARLRKNGVTMPPLCTLMDYNTEIPIILRDCSSQTTAVCSVTNFDFSQNGDKLVELKIEANCTMFSGGFPNSFIGSVAHRESPLKNINEMNTYITGRKWVPSEDFEYETYDVEDFQEGNVSLLKGESDKYHRDLEPANLLGMSHKDFSKGCTKTSVEWSLCLKFTSPTYERHVDDSGRCPGYVIDYLEEMRELAEDLRAHDRF